MLAVWSILKTHNKQEMSGVFRFLWTYRNSLESHAFPCHPIWHFPSPGQDPSLEQAVLLKQ